MSRCEITLSPEYPVSPSLLKSARFSLSDPCSKLLPAQQQVFLSQLGSLKLFFAGILTPDELHRGVPQSPAYHPDF